MDKGIASHDRIDHAQRQRPLPQRLVPHEAAGHEARLLELQREGDEHAVGDDTVEHHVPALEPIAEELLLPEEGAEQHDRRDGGRFAEEEGQMKIKMRKDHRHHDEAEEDRDQPGGFGQGIVHDRVKHEACGEDELKKPADHHAAIEPIRRLQPDHVAEGFGQKQHQIRLRHHSQGIALRDHIIGASDDHDDEGIFQKRDQDLFCPFADDLPVAVAVRAVIVARQEEEKGHDKAENAAQDGVDAFLQAERVERDHKQHGDAFCHVLLHHSGRRGARPARGFHIRRRAHAFVLSIRSFFRLSTSTFPLARSGNAG